MTDGRLQGEPLSDDELRELGRTMGGLVHMFLRLRRDGDQGMISVLSMLGKCGPARASDLARDLSLDLSTVSRHVQSLEKQGLLEKMADPTDRRAMTLNVTSDGKDHLEQLWERRVNNMREGLAHWDPEDLRTLSRLTARYTEDFTALLLNEDKFKHLLHGNGKTGDTGTTPTTTDRH